MNIFEILADDEIKTICSLIPHSMAKLYFQKNPKEFAKIKKGYRPSALSRKQTVRVLFSSRKSGFVSSFLNGVVNDWIIQIQNELKKHIDNGEDNITAFINVLPFSFFSNNVNIFFKLIQNNDDEQIHKAISCAVIAIKKKNQKLQELEKESLEKEKKIQDQIAKTSMLEKSIAKNKSLISKQNETERKYSKLKIEYDLQEKEIASLHKAISEKEFILMNQSKEIKLLNENNLKLNHRMNELEQNIRKQIEEERFHAAKNRFTSFQKPIDFPEFCEYLGYNLQSLFNDITPDTIILLKEYLANILFIGKPIISNRITASNISKCVSNTLTGNCDVSTLVYSSNLTNDEISNFISQSDRIIHFDSFIGNYNETELLPIIEEFHSKIVFLSSSYDRTLNYVSAGLWKYCSYLNINHISGSQAICFLDEEPSTFEMEDYVPTTLHENRFTRILNTILLEMRVPMEYANSKTPLPSSEKSLCCLLLFDIIPYFIEIRNNNPIFLSDSLQRYLKKNKANFNGLLEKWYNYE